MVGEWRSVCEGAVVRSYRELAVWRKAMDIAVSCHHMTEGFPRSEQYGLALQLRRAAISVPANIAEGQGRRHTTEFVQFPSITCGSLNELETHIELVGYADAQETKRLLEHTAEIGRMLNGLSRSLTSKSRPRKPTADH